MTAIQINLPSKTTPAPKSDALVAPPKYILFFDGECVMCNGIVKWLYAIDRGNALAFASLHGETAAKLREECEEFPKDKDSFVFWDDGTPRVRSRAALYAARKLKFPWNLGYALLIIPRFISDAVYRFVANHRLQWFGTTETCWLPPADGMHRFLE